MLPHSGRRDLFPRTSRLPRPFPLPSTPQSTLIPFPQDFTTTALHSRIPFLPTSSFTSHNSSTTLDIVALDCELVYTSSGMALARLTVIDSSGTVVLDEHVRPQGTVLDLNVRFSGVKQEHVEQAVLDLVGVRKALGMLVDEDTVVVGHGLENDLKALRWVHTKVVDTAIVRPLSLSVSFKMSTDFSLHHRSFLIRTEAPGAIVCEISLATSWARYVVVSRTRFIRCR